MCQPKKKPRRLVEDLDHRRGNQQAVTVSKELYGALYIDRNGHINVYGPVCNFKRANRLIKYQSQIQTGFTSIHGFQGTMCGDLRQGFTKFLEVKVWIAQRFGT